MRRLRRWIPTRQRPHGVLELKRKLTLAAPILLAVGIGTGASTSATATQAPNVLVVMTDDQDVASMSMMAKTRALWGAQGVTFTNFFGANAHCCPDRATWLTGQYAHNHGVWVSQPAGDAYGALDYRTTLPVWLQAAGYDTAWFGKFLNGYGSVNAPGQSGPPCDELPAGWNSWFVFLVAPYYNNYLVNSNGSVVRFGSARVPQGCVVDSSQANVYSTDRLRQRAENWIGQHAGTGRPWFLVVAPYAPHETDRQPPQPAPRHAGLFANDPFPIPGVLSYNEADVSDKPALISSLPLLTASDTQTRASFHRKRRESLLAVDEMVELLEAKLVATGQASNTVRVFSSDNGWANGEHRIPGWKYVAYDESVKVPLLVRGPGYSAGATRSELTGQIDMTATIVALTGAVPTRTLDGVDFGPLLRGESAPWRSGILLESRFQSFHDAIRTSSYTFVEHASGERELYDLASDPWQLESKHADPAYAAIQAMLADQLTELKACAGPSCWIP